MGNGQSRQTLLDGGSVGVARTAYTMAWRHWYRTPANGRALAQLRADSSDTRLQICLSADIVLCVHLLIATPIAVDSKY